MRPLFTSIFPDRTSKGRKTYGYIPERKENPGSIENSSSSRSDDQHPMYPLASRTKVRSTNEIDIHGGRGREDRDGNFVPGKNDIEIGERVEDDEMDGIN
ncbi:hypothetical protein MMC29_008285, partial [Sticta canariensis]|nr:hypothetical protein [Sticta canariensis]